MRVSCCPTLANKNVARVGYLQPPMFIENAVNSESLFPVEIMINKADLAAKQP
jgi:hypothetical protein